MSGGFLGNNMSNVRLDPDISSGNFDSGIVDTQNILKFANTGDILLYHGKNLAAGDPGYWKNFNLPELINTKIDGSGSIIGQPIWSILGIDLSTNADGSYKWNDQSILNKFTDALTGVSMEDISGYYTNTGDVSGFYKGGALGQLKDSIMDVIGIDISNYSAEKGAWSGNSILDKFSTALTGVSMEDISASYVAGDVSGFYKGGALGQVKDSIIDIIGIDISNYSVDKSTWTKNSILDKFTFTLTGVSMEDISASYAAGDVSGFYKGGVLGQVKDSIMDVIGIDISNYSVDKSTWTKNSILDKFTFTLTGVSMEDISSATNNFTNTTKLADLSGLLGVAWTDISTEMDIKFDDIMSVVPTNYFLKNGNILTIPSTTQYLDISNSEIRTANSEITISGGTIQTVDLSCTSIICNNDISVNDITLNYMSCVDISATGVVHAGYLYVENDLSCNGNVYTGNIYASSGISCEGAVMCRDLEVTGNFDCRDLSVNRTINCYELAASGNITATGAGGGVITSNTVSATTIQSTGVISSSLTIDGATYIDMTKHPVFGVDGPVIIAGGTQLSRGNNQNTPQPTSTDPQTILRLIRPGEEGYTGSPEVQFDLGMGGANWNYSNPQTQLNINLLGTIPPFQSAISMLNYNNVIKVGINNANPQYTLDVVGNIRCNGSIEATGAINSNASDDRIKHNEVDISNALSTINKLTPKHYLKTFKIYDYDTQLEFDASGNALDPSGNPIKLGDDYIYETGIIAQEIRKIPELAFCVNGEEYVDQLETTYEKDLSDNFVLDDTGNKIAVDTKIVQVKSALSVNYNSIFTTHIQATQELSAKNDRLKTDIATLKDDMAIIKLALGL